MDNGKIGKLIQSLRREKSMTQLQLAEQIGVTDKAVSKWERGLGAPDITLLGDLSQILGVNIEKILTGDLQSNETDGGNMKRIRFYVCPDCGGIVTSTGEAEVSCCGRKLEKLDAHPMDEEHHFHVETVEDEYYITSSHSMTKSHYISFLACVKMDRMMLVKLYPEQNAEIRIPRMRGATLYGYCTRHSLMKTTIR